MSTLVAHCGSYTVSEEEVRAVPSPEFTETWHPINHAQLLDTIEKVLPKLDLVVARREFALSEDKQRMFGIFDIKPINPNLGFTIAIGARNSIDKSLAAGVCLGSKVFVCDNLGFSGERELYRKHDSTIELELPQMVEAAISDFKSRFETEDAKLFEHWKQVPITKHQVSDFLLELNDCKKLTLNAVPKIRDNFLIPKHREFKERTVWSLFNAFTEYYKEQKLNPQDGAERAMNHFRRFKSEWPLTLAV